MVFKNIRRKGKKAKHNLKIIHYILIAIAGFFGILGILFSGLLVHELTHVYQTPEPNSICYDFNHHSMMHVTFNQDKVCEKKLYKDMHFCQPSYNATAFELFSEKSAYFAEVMFYVLASLVTGILLGVYLTSFINYLRR